MDADVRRVVRPSTLRQMEPHWRILSRRVMRCDAAFGKMNLEAEWRTEWSEARVEAGRSVRKAL